MTKTGPNSFKKNVSIDPPDPKPIITVLLICVLPLFMTNGHIDWVDNNGFTPMQMADAVRQGPGSIIGLIPTMFKAALGELSPLMWVLNGLFIWIFGNVIEKKLKTWRYPLFVCAMVITGWFCVYANAGFNVNKLYIGPSMLLFGMLGGFFAFLPKKPHKPLPWVKPPTEIFKKEDTTPIHERYWVNPWLYISAFAVYQIILQVALNMDKDAIVNATNMNFLGTVYTALLGRIQVNPGAFQPVAAVMQIAVGAGLAYMLPMFALSIKTKRPGGRLQLEVIQHYRELRTLDMNHEAACEGAAKFAAVPIEIAKDWISKGAAGLKDQDLRK